MRAPRQLLVSRISTFLFPAVSAAVFAAIVVFGTVGFGAGPAVAQSPTPPTTLNNAGQQSSSAPQVTYQPPVQGAVVDGWRPPPGPYGAGNRGIDYATQPGQPVGAPAAGVVSFAGSVGGTRWVVVRHADGRRSSVGPLAAILVATGASVAAGQTIGTAAGSAIHWGVREADVYVDPSTLLPPVIPGRGRLRLTG